MKKPNSLELMTTAEAADFLKIQPDTLRRKSKKLLIPHYDIPGAGMRFDREELERWVAQWKVLDKYTAAEAVL